MNCPPEIAEILVSILRMGILQIRAAGWSGDSRRCAIEADHIHNLTSLLDHYSPELLKYYWEVERPSFISQVAEADLAGFESLWNRLARQVAGQSEEVPAR
jgi:hypothetical protein